MSALVLLYHKTTIIRLAYRKAYSLFQGFVGLGLMYGWDGRWDGIYVYSASIVLTQNLFNILHGECLHLLSPHLNAALHTNYMPNSLQYTLSIWLTFVYHTLT